MSTEHKSNTATEIKDLWQTPKFLFDYYNSRFEFNLDMAASEKNFLCKYYLTEQMNSLDPSSVSTAINTIWMMENKSPSVFLNPPYSDLKPWVDAAIKCSNNHKVPVVMLIPADTSVKWFKLAFDNCTECHFISGRLSFINAETQKPVNGNNKGSVVFIFDPKSPVKQSVHLINRDDMKNG